MMRFTRVTLFFIAFIITLGFYQLARHFLSEVEPQVFQATEEVMIDIANILAEVVEKEVQENSFKPESLREAFEGAHCRVLEAKIFEYIKRGVGVHFYLADIHGVVIFDSDHGRREGLNFMGKRDVALTLAGKYGARSSRDDESDSTSSVLYIGAPVGDPLNPNGVLTVYKSQSDVLPLVYERRRIIYSACFLIGGGILFLIGAVFLWLFHPIGKITEYARAIERGERPAKPKIGIGREVNTLARALDSMRDVLEGRRYVERYIQTLAHEMKSPLAAIRGAAELLDEEMPVMVRQRFLENIRAEVVRSERLINRLLELSAIEGRSHLAQPTMLDFKAVVARSLELARPMAELAGVNLKEKLDSSDIHVLGEFFILRAAVTNLLENAIDFSPTDGEVEVSVTLGSDSVMLWIRDQGPGIPEYAREKVFERFYSLRHHASKRKGTGLGLTLVRETVDLHGGSVLLETAVGGGTIAKLTLPLG